MARATNSLPVPLSPVISTLTSCAATRPIALKTSSIEGQDPRIASPRSSSGAGGAVPVLRGAEAPRDLRRDQIRVVAHNQQSAQGAPRRSTRLGLPPGPTPPVRGAMTKAPPKIVEPGVAFSPRPAGDRLD